MTERTALLLASLSHQWFSMIVSLPILFGLATYFSGVFRARTRFSANALTRRAGKVLRVFTYTLFVVSLGVFGVALIHVGCSAIVAHRAQCASHLKQLARGTLMYAQDYDERLPDSAHWAEAIAARISNTPPEDDPFRCPASKSPGSYAMNAALGGLALSRLDAPAETVLFFDAEAPKRSFAGGSPDVARSRHNSAPNVGFVDGHVKAANPSFQAKLIWTPKETPEEEQTGP